ncbi:hypothetical protein ACYZT4_08520 [Pseudomonas sp. GB2N2]
MSDITHSCADSSWPDSSFVPHSEYESGFLLPQLMGALATESGGLEMRGACPLRSNKALFLKLWASLMQALNLRYVSLK